MQHGLKYTLPYNCVSANMFYFLLQNVN